MRSRSSLTDIGKTIDSFRRGAFDLDCTKDVQVYDGTSTIPSFPADQKIKSSVLMSGTVAAWGY